MYHWEITNADNDHDSGETETMPDAWRAAFRAALTMIGRSLRPAITFNVNGEDVYVTPARYSPDPRVNHAATRMAMNALRVELIAAHE